MKKLLSISLLAFGILFMNQKVHAGSLPRSPKEVFVSSYTTGAVSITPAISTNAVSSAAYMPGAVYQVLLASGAASEFVLLVDTTNCAGITATMGSASLTPPANFLGPKLLFSSTTANTDYKFDPPMIFENGLCVIDSAVTGQYSVTYELGRGLSGN